MRSNILITALIAALSPSFTSADASTTDLQLTSASLPSSCHQICAPIVKLTGICMVANTTDSSNAKTTSNLLLLARENINPKKKRMDLSPVDMQNMQEEDSQLEIACICGNKSFDVNSVVGLCQGCVDQNMSTMQGKMVVDNLAKNCNVSKVAYTSSETSLVADVVVSAVKPKMAANSTSGAGELRYGGQGLVTIGVFGAGLVLRGALL